MKHANTGRNYAILTKLVKVEHEKKPELNLKSMQIVGFQQASTKFLRFSSCKNNFFIGKKTCGNLLSGYNDSSNVLCFDLYLINLFAKSMKDRYEDINILGTCYFVVLNSTFSAQ